MRPCVTTTPCPDFSSHNLFVLTPTHAARTHTRRARGPLVRFPIPPWRSEDATNQPNWSRVGAFSLRLSGFRRRQQNPPSCHESRGPDSGKPEARNDQKYRDSRKG